MAFKEIKVQEDVSPNLIPMIDIMFLLLLFFMLNADMAQRELEEITPPIAIHATEDKPEPGSERITANVHHNTKEQTACAAFEAGTVCRDDTHWHISVQGRKYKLDKDGMKQLSDVLTALGKKHRADPSDPNSHSERKLIMRVDRIAPYGHVQKLVEQASIARIWKVEVAAGLPKEEANKNK